ncbi:MAG: hypothetical protein ACRD0U_10015, partial [Acidimicrobiales bacterium]
MSTVELLGHRRSGDYDVDEWGLDREFVELVSPLCALRWRITVDGADRIPTDGPVVVVHSRRFSLSEPFVLARGIRLASDRWVRVLGAPDIAPAGPLLRRFGA